MAAGPLRLLEGTDLRSGKKLTVSLTNSPRATVLVFVSARCPCSSSHEASLVSLAKRFPAFNFVAIHSNVNETFAESESHFKKADFPFPVLQDTKAQWADQFGALKTPHVFVVDPTGSVVFSGGVDDSHNASTAHHFYLQDALSNLQSGQEPHPKTVRTLGCVISRS